MFLVVHDSALNPLVLLPMVPIPQVNVKCFVNFIMFEKGMHTKVTKVMHYGFVVTCQSKQNRGLVSS